MDLLKEKLESPVKVLVTGTVEQLNRLAVVQGQNGKTRAAKSVIQLRFAGDNIWQIWISSSKNIEGQKYDVNNIQNLRTNYVSEGKLTMEFRQPPINIMLRDCKADTLTFFVQKIQYLQKKKRNSSTPLDNTSCSKDTKDNKDKDFQTKSKASSQQQRQQNCGGSSSSISSTSNTTTTKMKDQANIISNNNNNTMQVTKGILDNSKKSGNNLNDSSSKRNLDNNEDEDISGNIMRIEGRGLKRRHSEMSKNELKNIKKALKTSTSLTVKQRANYPIHGMDKNLTKIEFLGIGLRKVDAQLFNLPYLTSLSLEANRIISIDLLSKLPSCLELLDVSNNQIESISSNLFRCRSLSKLKVLNLSRNQLKKLPDSICDLGGLHSLDVSYNHITALPYNMHLMRNLTKLKGNDNHLEFLPYPLSSVTLQYLDVSSNLFKKPDRPPRSVRLESEPTLFELAGSALLTQYYKSKVRGEVPQVNVFHTSQVPRIICEYLNTGKYCYSCGRMHLRYTLLYSPSYTRFADTIVNTSDVIPVCRVLCNKCHPHDP